MFPTPAASPFFSNKLLVSTTRRSNSDAKDLVSAAGSHFIKAVSELGRTFMSAARAVREGGASGADIARLLGRGFGALRGAMSYVVNKVLVGLSELPPKRDLDENVPPRSMARPENRLSIPLVQAVYFEQGTEFDSVPSTPSSISGDGAEPTTSGMFENHKRIDGDEYSKKSNGRPALMRSAAMRFDSDSEFSLSPSNSVLGGQARVETEGEPEPMPTKRVRFKLGNNEEYIFDNRDPVSLGSPLSPNNLSSVRQQSSDLLPQFSNLLRRSK